MSLQNKFISLVTSEKIEDFLSKNSLVCFSFTSEIDSWQTLAECDGWKLEISSRNGICRVVDSHIIRKVSSSIEKIEELMESYL